MGLDLSPRMLENWKPGKALLGVSTAMSRVLFNGLVVEQFPIDLGFWILLYIEYYDMA